MEINQLPLVLDGTHKMSVHSNDERERERESDEDNQDQKAPVCNLLHYNSFSHLHTSKIFIMETLLNEI